MMAKRYEALFAAIHASKHCERLRERCTQRFAGISDGKKTERIVVEENPAEGMRIPVRGDVMYLCAGVIIGDGNYHLLFNVRGEDDVPFDMHLFERVDGRIGLAYGHIAGEGGRVYANYGTNDRIIDGLISSSKVSNSFPKSLPLLSATFAYGAPRLGFAQ